jgi:hypothetical protein
MSTFAISHDLLMDLFAVNQFTLPSLEMIFIGLRGAVVSDPNDNTFKQQPMLNVTDIDYIHPRCTIMQWRPASRDIATFPASTVPNQINIQKSLDGGEKANCLVTGFFKDYRKGIHKDGKPTGHPAFRQNAPRPIQRTRDDIDFDRDDRIEYENPNDNIHCGWFQSLSSSNFASAGCQVIMGFPKCERPGRDKNVGPWKVFHDNAYRIGQDSFPYALVNGQEAFGLTNNGAKTPKLRFGSSGPKVEALQLALKGQNFYDGRIDGDFGEITMTAVIRFQQQRFGNDDADGIVGRITAEELGIDIRV